MLNELWEQIKQASRDANVFGINLPMVKDPKTQVGSVSLTLLVISATLVILGLIGKWSGYLGIVDINNALEFFYGSSALYFGRKWTSKSQGTLDPTPTQVPETPPSK